MPSVNDVLSVLIVAAPVLVPVMCALYQLLVAQLPAAKRDKVEHDVRLVVSAVEQIYGSVPGSGAYKKAEVQRLLTALGVKGVDPVLLDTLIEAAVAALPVSVPPAQPPVAPSA